jgi:hypothetical protein
MVPLSHFLLFMKIRPENITIAKELGITPEMVAYIRPRLANAYYNGDIKKLRESIANHLKMNMDMQAIYEKALKRREKQVRSDLPNAAEHMKKANNLRFSLKSSFERRPFYQSMMKFLATITPEQLQILTNETQ